MPLSLFVINRVLNFPYCGSLLWATTQSYTTIDFGSFSKGVECNVHLSVPNPVSTYPVYNSGSPSVVEQS